MTLEELKKQFIVDEDILRERLEPVVSKALKHCRIDKNGQVLITNGKLSAKNRIKLVIAARAIAAQLDANIASEVTASELTKFTGLPANQVRARGSDAIKEKFAQSSRAGVYQAIAYKVEPFLDEISEQPDHKS